MKIINIGGAINAGKSTVSQILTDKLENALFIEVDDLLSEREDALLADFDSRINARLNRLYGLLENYVENGEYGTVVFAYPMSRAVFERTSEIAKGKADFVVVTLNPPLEKCLTNRGARELDDWETNRIKEMYRQGFNTFYGSDLIINNDGETPEETADRIIAFLGGMAQRGGKV